MGFAACNAPLTAASSSVTSTGFAAEPSLKAIKQEPLPILLARRRSALRKVSRTMS